jgi:carboxyl-terminal processing protease
MTGGFTQTTAEELRQALDTFRREGVQQVVLDLRNNPGGLLGQSIEVASQFIERGKGIVSVRGRGGETNREYKSTTSEPVPYPLVILINRNSASASEIVAGAVQDHGRGILVGETSFGKGLVQKVFQLPYGAGLTLTTAKYYTPYGRLIQREYTGGSFYDYYTRHVAEAAPSPQTPAQPSVPAVPGAAPAGVPTPLPTPQATPSGPAIMTAAGRVFYGGGGITPDYEVKPIDLTAPARARIFEESFFFVRALVGGQIPGFESYRLSAGPQFGRYPRPTDLPVTDKLLEAFRAFVRKDPESGLSVKQLDAELDYARLRLRDDIITAAYGTDASGRFLLESDPQFLRALELIPEARTLAEHVSRFKASE